MIDVESYRHYAADCVRRAQSEQAPEDKTILLNVALAWLRLAQQRQALVAKTSAADAAAPADDTDAPQRELAS